MKKTKNKVLKTAKKANLKKKSSKVIKKVRKKVSKKPKSVIEISDKKIHDLEENSKGKEKISMQDAVMSQCDIVRDNGLRPILTIRSHGKDGEPTDGFKSKEEIEAYKKKLQDVIDNCDPSLITVDYKESSELFYKGTSEEYLEKLKIAVGVAHSDGVRVTNGGLESDFVALIMFAHLIEEGDIEKASWYASKAFTPEKLRELDSKMASKKIAKLFKKGNELLDIYAKSGIDYLNIHWTIDDPEVLRETAEYLKREVGLRLVSTELKIPPNLEKELEIIKTVNKLEFPYVIWYFSVEGSRLGELLDEEHDKLTPISEEFRNYTIRRYVNFIPRIRNWLREIPVIRSIRRKSTKLIINIAREWRLVTNPRARLSTSS